jgi:enoyl-CoA hydratase/carnithine racemase
MHAEAMISTENDGDVTIIRMGSGENRFHPALLDELNAALDEVERGSGPGAVVITGEGKFFSNGLDLDYMATAGEEEAERVLGRVHALFARLLGFPTATVAALNGHAFAAGAMLALACDQRVMRADRGWFCLPEVDIGIPFTPGMQALLTSRMTPAVAHESMLTGRRYPADDALAAGLVDAIAPEGDVLATAIVRAGALAAKQRHTVKAIKRGLYADAIAALTSSPQALEQLAAPR